MNEENYISEEVFEELVNGLDFIGSFTLYGRKSLKYHIKRLQEENQELKAQYCERTDCSGRIGNSKKVEELKTEKEQLNSLVNSCQEEIRRLKQQLEQRDNIINKAREYVDKFIPIDEDTILMRIRQKDYLLEILNYKGE